MEELAHFTLRNVHHAGFGAATVGAAIAIALVGIAIDQCLRFVDNTGWRWTLLIILSIVGVVVIVWWLWMLLRWGTCSRRHMTAHKKY